MKYGRTIEIRMAYAQAVPRVKQAFKDHGFGTLTEIDVKKTLKEKLDVEMEEYVIRGVCNPGLAHRGAPDRARPWPPAAVQCRRA